MRKFKANVAQRNPNLGLPDQTMKIQYAGHFKETVLFSCSDIKKVCFIIRHTETDFTQLSIQIIVYRFKMYCNRVILKD